MPEDITSTPRLFADDTVIYNSADNHKVLQDDLKRLESWALETDMEFNPLKSEHIFFTRKSSESTFRSSTEKASIQGLIEVSFLRITAFNSSPKFSL